MPQKILKLLNFKETSRQTLIKEDLQLPQEKGKKEGFNSPQFSANKAETRPLQTGKGSRGMAEFCQEKSEHIEQIPVYEH